MPRSILSKQTTLTHSELVGVSNSLTAASPCSEDDEEEDGEELAGVDLKVLKASLCPLVLVHFLFWVFSVGGDCTLPAIGSGRSPVWSLHR